MLNKKVSLNNNSKLMGLRSREQIMSNYVAESWVSQNENYYETPYTEQFLNMIFPIEPFPTKVYAVYDPYNSKCKVELGFSGFTFGTWSQSQMGEGFHVQPGRMGAVGHYIEYYGVGGVFAYERPFVWKFNAVYHFEQQGTKRITVGELWYMEPKKWDGKSFWN